MQHVAIIWYLQEAVYYKTTNKIRNTFIVFHILAIGSISKGILFMTQVLTLLGKLVMKLEKKLEEEVRGSESL